MPLEYLVEYRELTLGQLKDVNIRHFLKCPLKLGSINLNIGFIFLPLIFALIFTNRSFSHKTSKQQLKNNNKVSIFVPAIFERSKKHFDFQFYNKNHHVK